MAPQQHQAAFLDGAQKPLRVASADTAQPGPGELLVRTAAVAINPVDWKIQGSGAFIQKWPAILGEDLAGEVVAVGDNVTAFTKGQRVLAHSLFLASQRNPEGAFQEYVVVPQTAAAVVPDNVAYEAAATLPLAVSTAAAGLFPAAPFLGLDLPDASGKASGKGSLLLWGASASVGTAALQLAVAAGYDVVATASPRNFDLVKSLGAKAVLDYHSESIVSDLVAELKKGGKFVGAYDAIGLRDVQVSIAQVVHELGGGKVATVLPPIDDAPTDVAIKNVFAPAIFSQFPDVGKAVYGDYLTEGLKSGQFKPAPPPDVVGKGLDFVQGAIDKLKAGVSASKIIVTL